MKTPLRSTFLSDKAKICTMASRVHKYLLSSEKVPESRARHLICMTDLVCKVESECMILKRVSHKSFLNVVFHAMGK